MATDEALSVEQAVAMVASHAASAPSSPTAAAGASPGPQTVASAATVAGQIVTRKKVSRRLLILNLRPASGADRAQRGGEGAASDVFLTVIVKEQGGVGEATMDWVRHGARQLRLGDYLRCSGVLEADPQAGAVLVAGAGGLEVLERFEEQHPGCHWEGHLFAVPSVPRRVKPEAARRADEAAAAGGGDMFDTRSLAGAIKADESAASAATDASGVERYCERPKAPPRTSPRAAAAAATGSLRD